MIKLEQACLISFLILICWLPIPLASNRTWALSVAEMWIALQSITLLVSYKFDLPWHRVKRFKWLLIPLGVFQVWVFIQSQPLPAEWLSVISPNAYLIFNSLGLESTSISLDRHLTYLSFLKGLSYFLFALNAVLLINNVNRIKWILTIVVASGTFQAFYGAMTVLLGLETSLLFSFEEKGLATGTFVYKNHLANYLMLSLSLGVGLIVSQLHASESGSWDVRIKRWVTAMLSSKMIIRLCLVIMVIALVMTRSRMGNTAFFITTVVAGLLALAFYKDRPRALTVMIVSILAIDTLVVGTVFGLGKVKERLETTSIEAETRDQVVEWSLEIIKDYPITGTGMGSFYSTFPSYAQYNVGFYDHAHNEYVQFASEAGIPATLMLGATVLYALWMAFSSMRTRNSRTLKGTGLGCIMAILGMLIHISVDFNLQPPANALTFILILVLAVASKHMSVRIEKPRENNV